MSMWGRCQRTVFIKVCPEAFHKPAAHYPFLHPLLQSRGEESSEISSGVHCGLRPAHLGSRLGQWGAAEGGGRRGASPTLNCFSTGHSGPISPALIGTIATSRRRVHLEVWCRDASLTPPAPTTHPTPPSPLQAPRPEAGARGWTQERGAPRGDAP